MSELTGRADPWRALRPLTSARIGRRTVGDSPTTSDLLGLRADQAVARDALRVELDIEGIRRGLDGVDVVLVSSAAPDLGTHLLRPDLGRRLVAGTVLASEREPDLVFVLADGLSAGAVNDLGVPLVRAARQALPDWLHGPVVLARRARVALGDEIGLGLGARFVAVCIGERPGLSSPRSMSVYLTMSPQPGRVDAERNCISNIGPHGTGVLLAAQQLAWLLRAAEQLGQTGTALKDGFGLSELG